MIARTVFASLMLFLVACFSAPAEAQTAPATKTYVCHGNNGVVTFTMPAGVSPVCTKNFAFSGVCNGQDIVAVSNENWEGSDIVIVGVSLAFYQVPAGIQYTFAGNSDVPDVMLWGGAGQTWASKSFPSGSGMLFRANGSHIDLHVACNSGHFAGQQIIDYIPSESAPAG